MRIKIMDNSKSKTFSTDNFQLASYLLSESCRLTSLDKTNPKRVVFVFGEDEQTKSLIQTFLSYEARVEPHRFFSAQRDLKQLIYEKQYQDIRSAK